MAILLNYHGMDNQLWKAEMQKHLPEMPIFIYPDIPDRDSVHYALAWAHSEIAGRGDFKNYPNLRAIFALGAGLDSFLSDDLPDVPLVPLHDPSAAHDMALHSLFWVVNFQRHYQQYQQLQNQKTWQPLPYKRVSDFKIGVLGLGRIASHVAKTLSDHHYPVRAWVRSEKADKGKIQQFYPPTKIENFLQPLDVLINCLPLNDETENFIDADFIAKMPKGSFLINISRGKIIDERALCKALQSQHLAAASLDVTHTEPLPSDNPLWVQKNCFITPHISGDADIMTSCKILAENIMRVERGQKPTPIFDIKANHLISYA